ncbi:hypothetical protein [Micromonospora sp. WMMC273]|uniref:hypothetical protein n=1 Tax=Micromonospora sp. WMMC273 TaxID=3015157 RepID=UPI0022B637A7|nr:hypothetical protein [Micromonospora sp. WMMC273]MCZ7478871.1 hypothetical protein [Micromonospora sp. WMMC273]MCZ7478980.1 hypothetical protein [Micromonospora sp. WMMC273]
MADENDDGQGYQPERWVFGGSRASKGRRVHAWVPPGATAEDELWFPVIGGGKSIGGVYEVHVRRSGEKVSMQEGVTFIGRGEDTALILELEVRHREAETYLSMRQAERNAGRMSELDAALAPLERLMAKAPPMQRDALLVLVLRRLANAR